MLKRFYPNLFFPSVFDIPYDQLMKEKGIQALVFDIDNTLVPFDIETPTLEILGLMADLGAKGFKIGLLSNNHEARVAGFNIQLNLPFVAQAKKPTGKGLRKAMALLGCNPTNTAMIGDQLFTDVWGGNRQGLLTVLVHPVSERDEWTVRLKRSTEKWVLGQYKKYLEKYGIDPCMLHN